MKTTAHTRFAEHAGRSLGRMWRVLVRLDRKAQGGLVTQGWSLGAASAALLVTKLVLFGVLAYVAFWPAMSLALLALVAWNMRGSATWDAEGKDEPEWREGHGGFGLYDKNEWRHDMCDPDKQ
ncbi:conserved hypothetical protein [Aromatoleum aromaticum EbN1]|uniref:DUF3742 domain-containing protein n=1 Tax=Aromatoleum aromaticum (strain DSM 19018 / LMG 30748 / EbN1) TaxID=76114 RepID=Q5P5F2_AROAE|nr:DUF3742 family protein [Aromatoleum aromaticum]CAI07460.1 conserved hypothetical protein [Aromatoleum aromaticum EbN1]